MGISECIKGFHDVLLGAARSPAFAPLLEGKWIQTAKGPIQLGQYIGKGAMAAVNRNPLKPGEVLKVSNGTAEGQLSIPRQFEHTARLKAAKVPHVKVHEQIPAAADKPAILRMDHLEREFPTATRFEPGEWGMLDQFQKTPYELAIQEAGQKVGDAGYIASDFHSGNFGFRPKRGGVEAIVIDGDMVWTTPEFLEGLNTAPFGRRAQGLLFNGPYHDYLMSPPRSAPAWMDALFRSRFKYDRVNSSHSGTPPASSTPRTPMAK